jgi:hypothetical protein
MEELRMTSTRIDLAEKHTVRRVSAFVDLEEREEN